ncbi:MAG: TlpA disulfide reductase family protein [Proteobacteria bacterium]|nr:TlpA disulfide reductase family protein [Pseudomonadota bacterium]
MISFRKLSVLFPIFFIAGSLFALEPGKKIPEFSLRDCNGNLHYSADLCGAKAMETKVLIVDFFSTSCVPCKKALPVLVKIYEKYKDKGLKVVLVSYQEREKTLREFAEKNGVKFPVLMDKYGEAAQAFGVFGLPRTFIVGADCTLKKQIIGERKDLEIILENEIKLKLDADKIFH